VLKQISRRSGNPKVVNALKRKILKSQHDVTRYEKKKLEKNLNRLGDITSKAARKKAIKKLATISKA
jgi:hypothetical protein